MGKWSDEDKAFRKDFKRREKERKRMLIEAGRAELERQRTAFREANRPRRWTAEPGSTLAMLRIACHRSYDPLWEFGTVTRKDVYAALAGAMRMPVKHCHFGMFDEAHCRFALVLRNDPRFLERLP